MQKRTSESPELLNFFPKNFSRPRTTQVQALVHIEKSGGSATIQAPTGTGKTALGYTVLEEGDSKGEQPLDYIVPNKTLVQEGQKQHPDFKVAYGRHEHDCLFYDSKVKADEIPCRMHVMNEECPHYVDQETGETFEKGAQPCWYYQQKYEAKQRGKVIETMQFFLFTRLFSREFDRSSRLVIDEAHRIAEVFRNALSYEITDYHLLKAVDLLEEIGATGEASELKKFTRRMVALIRRRPAKTPELLKDQELIELMDLVEPLAAIGKKLFSRVSQAVREGLVDRFEKREVLKKVETLVYDLKRYLSSLGYSLETDKRKPLMYTYAFYVEEVPEPKRVQHKLVIKSYYVAPLIRKLLARKTVAMSATIGEPSIFSFETGIDSPFISLSSTFPAKNRRLFLPIDNADLSYNNRAQNEPNRTLRRILRAVKLFAEHGHRSLVVVVSNKELAKILRFAQEEVVAGVSYGDGVLAKDALERFKSGEGDALFGTVAHYGEGIDLPDGIAPITFMLRPDWPDPFDPEAQFEERRFSRARVWALRKWRVVRKAEQVSGRNVRSSRDLGVCFFMSKQYRSLLPHGLSEYLKESFVGHKTFDECVQDTLDLLAT